MGIKGSTTGELLFEGCRVPADGWWARREGVSHRHAGARPLAAGDRRPGAGHRPGRARLALRYSTQRETFGRPLCEHQGIQFMLADMAVKVEASRGLLYESASCSTRASTGLS